MARGCCGCECTTFKVTMTVLFCFFWVGDVVCGYLVRADALSYTASVVIAALATFFSVDLIVLYFIALCMDRDGASASPRDEIPLARVMDTA